MRLEHVPDVVGGNRFYTLVHAEWMAVQRSKATLSPPMFWPQILGLNRGNWLWNQTRNVSVTFCSLSGKRPALCSLSCCRFRGEHGGRRLRKQLWHFPNRNLTQSCWNTHERGWQECFQYSLTFVSADKKPWKQSEALMSAYERRQKNQTSQPVQHKVSTIPSFQTHKAEPNQKTASAG